MGSCFSNGTELIADEHAHINKRISLDEFVLITGYQRESKLKTFIVDDVVDLILEYYSGNRTAIYRIGGVSYGNTGSIKDNISSIAIRNELTQLSWFNGDGISNIYNVYPIDTSLLTAFLSFDANGILSIYSDQHRLYELHNIDQICYVHTQNGHVTAILPKNNLQKPMIGFMDSNALFPDSDLQDNDVVKYATVRFKDDKSNEIKSIKNVLMTDSDVYLLTNNGKVYQRNIISAKSQVFQGKTKLLFYSLLSNEFSKIIITNVECNDLVSFFIDNDHKVYAKGVDKYGLIPEYTMTTKIYSPFYNNDNDYVHIKRIYLGLQHAVATDINHNMFIWGSNAKRQCGVEDGHPYNVCCCSYDIPVRIGIEYVKVPIIDGNKKRNKHQRFRYKVNLKHSQSYRKQNLNDIDAKNENKLIFDEITCGDHHTFLVSNNNLLNNNDPVVIGFGANDHNQCLLYESELDNDMKTNVDFVLPMRMTVIETMMMRYKGVKVIARNNSTIVVVNRY